MIKFSLILRHYFRRPLKKVNRFHTLFVHNTKIPKRPTNTKMTKILEAFVLISSFLYFVAISSVGASEEWMQISPTIAFQSKIDPARNDAQMIRATNIAIDRMLSSQESNDFYTSSYSLGMEDMNKDWDDSQMAWHLLGFYVDCAYKKDGRNDGRKKRGLQEDNQEDEHHDEQEADKTCTRNVMYAVVSSRFQRPHILYCTQIFEKSSAE